MEKAIPGKGELRFPLLEEISDDGRLQTWIGSVFCDAADGEGLSKDAERLLNEALPEILDQFYERVAAVPELAALFRSSSRAARLKPAQLAHWRRVISGDLGPRHRSHVRRIGGLHYMAGVDPNAFLLGHRFITGRLQAVLITALPPHEAASAVAQLGRLASFDSCLALAAYWTSALHEVERIEGELEQLALRDPLTGLANRRLFDDRLRQALRAAERSGRTVAVLRLDVDDFKAINDGYGHEAGDAVLRAVARRLQRHLRGADTVARIGGDEFAIILPSLGTTVDLSRLGHRILHSLARPYRHGDVRIHATASLGCALYPRHGSAPEPLLTAADRALYRAKKYGGNRCGLDPQSPRGRGLAQGWLADFERALEERELELFYQPQVELESGRVLGCEALLRWRHPKHGLLAPHRFLPTVERSPLMHRLAGWCCESSCRMLARLHAEAGFEGTIAFNLSRNQVRGAHLVRTIEQCLARHRVPAHALQVEITEDVVMDEGDRELFERLQQFRDLGLAIALDDFGTGFASLVHLNRLPIDCLKLDRSFVAGITRCARARRIAQAVIRLGRHIRARVVAEGVENERQANLLRRMQCEVAQGYRFAPPLAAEELFRWLGKTDLRPTDGCRGETRMPTAEPLASV